MGTSDVLKVLKITQTHYFVRGRIIPVLVCVAFNMFLFFAFSLSCSTMFWFDKANRLSVIFFSLWCSNLALPRCFHSNFRIALYNLDCTFFYAFAIGQSGTRYFVEYIIKDLI